MSVRLVADQKANLLEQKFLIIGEDVGWGEGLGGIFLDPQITKLPLASSVKTGSSHYVSYLVFSLTYS